MIRLFTIGFIFLALSAFGADKDAERLARLHELFPNVPANQIILNNGQGKIDIDPDHRVSYFIYSKTPDSPMMLIPMSTVRFDSTFVPLGEGNQNVEAYLKAHELSTNPDVIEVPIPQGSVMRTPLKEFLIKVYESRFANSPTITVFRGAEKPGERAKWEARGSFPRGATYWTPDANYAWRYGRRMEDFLSTLAKEESPMFRYEIPKDEFFDLVRRDKIVLGFELPQRVHANFPSYGKAIDHLLGGDYLGDPEFGIELEVRVEKWTKDRFLNYYRGSVTIREMVEARRHQLQEGYARLMAQDPSRKAALVQERDKRLARVGAEGELLEAARDNDRSRIESARARLPSGRAEILNNDFMSVDALCEGALSDANSQQ